MPPEMEGSCEYVEQTLIRWFSSLELGGKITFPHNNKQARKEMLHLDRRSITC
jgi:hypothetical protein